MDQHASTQTDGLPDDQLRSWAESQGIQLTDQDQISSIRSLRADVDAIAHMRARRQQLLTELSPQTRSELARMLAKF